MAITYLAAVNDLLKESNETQLTSASFGSAVGIHAFVKSTVNRSYLDICAYKKTWPFLSATNSNANDPFAGNATVSTVEGTRWYLLKTGSTSVLTDYREVDWLSFFITTEGVSGETTPYYYKKLKYISFDEWFDKRSEKESQDAGDAQNYGDPEFIFPSRDGRFFGLSSIPKKEYRIYFNAWERPTALTEYDSVLLVPDEFYPVVLDKARYYLHQFKENEMQANHAKQDYRNGLNKMTLDLIGEKVKDMTDDRVR